MEKIKFSIDEIDNYLKDDDPEFATVRLKFLSDGENSHGYNISLDVLKRDAHTMLGKWIVAKYNNFTGDVMAHEIDEIIVGKISENAKITYEESENGTFMCVDGVLSKLYATKVVEMFKANNHRSVSVEMLVGFEDPEDIKSPVTKIIFTAVTILGMSVNPSCKGANIEVTKFSTDEAEKYYTSHKESALVKFAKERKKLEKGSDSVEETKLELEQEQDKAELSADENVDNVAKEKDLEEQAEDNKEKAELEEPCECEEDAKLEEEEKADEPEQEQETDEKAELASKDKVIMETKAELDTCKAELAEIKEKFEAQSVEFAKLQEFKNQEDAKALKFAVDQAMSEVKGILKPAQFEELANEGMACTIDNLDGFVTKVKAVAFESMKTKKKSVKGNMWSCTAFADENIEKPKNSLWD